MHSLYSFLLSEIVFIPFCVALFRWRRIDKAYYPFCILLGLGTVQEIISYFIIHWLHHSNAASVNIDGLLECSLILFQFYYWNSFSGGRKILSIFLVASLGLWATCNLFLPHLNDWDFPLYRILYAFLIVILSINEINLMITHDNRNLYKNARFIICLGFITFFLYQILYEGAFFVSGVDKTEVVSNQIISLFSGVNAFVNCLYLVAVWLIPRRRSSDFERIFERIRSES